MPIEEQLLSDEKILASAKFGPLSRQFLYATNQRLIRYGRGDSDNVETMSYPQIVSVSYEDKSTISVTGRVLSTVIGIACIAPLLLLFWRGILVLGINAGSLIGGLVLLVGIIGLKTGLSSQKRFYEIKAVGPDTERETWITWKADREAKKFAGVVQDQISTHKL